MSNTQKTVKSISSQSVVTLVLGLFEILLFSIMSRLLTREDFGYYAAMGAITTVFASFTETGIGSALIQKKQVNIDYYNSAITLSLIIGSFLTLLLFSLSEPLSRLVVGNKSLSIPLRLMSFSLLCNCLTSINYSVMYKKLQFLKVGVIKLSVFVMSAAVAITMAANGYGFYAIVAEYVTLSILALVVSQLTGGIKYKLSFDRGIVKDIWGFSGWLMASAVFRNVASQVDRLVMPRVLSVSALGSYSRPQGLIEKLSSKVNSIFDVSLFPILSKIQDDVTALQRAFDKVYYFMNLVGMSLSLILFFNAHLFVRVFLGEQWLDLTSLFQLMSIAVIFKIQARLADCMLRSLAMTKTQFYFRIIEFVTKILAVLIGSRWGLWGCAYSVVIADIVVRVVKILYVAHKIHYNTYQVFNKMFVSWRFTLIVVPPMILTFILKELSVTGDVIMLVSTLIVFVFAFVVTPSVIGSLYKEIVFDNIIMKHLSKNGKTKRN